MPEEFSPTPTAPITPVSPPTPPAPTLPTRRINPALVAAIIAILALLGYAAWQFYSGTPAATPANEATNSSQTATTSSNQATSSAIPASLKENIAAAISSKNTAALEGYMATSVNSVIAASGKGGPVTPAQAVTDLDYLSAGTSPWNFNLSAATLTGFKNGSYGSYFGDMTYVGQSTNGYVVSFGINSSGKIATIFMAQSASLLN